MLAYYLLLGIPVLLEIINSFNTSNDLDKTRKIKSEKKIVMVFFVIFFLILSFRSIDVGVDLPNYKYYFSKFGRMNWSLIWDESREPFYAVLNKFVSSIGGDFRFFLVAVAFITVAPFAFFYYKECENAMLTISIFINVSIFTMFFSGLRQAIAFSLGIIAFYCVKNKKRIAFLLCVFIAYLFHNSAFVLLALYPIYYMKITKKSFKLIVPLMAVLFVFKQHVFNFLLNFLSEEYRDRYEGIEASGAYTIFILFVLFTIYSFVGINDDALDEKTNGLRNILVIATCLQMFAGVHDIAMRMNYYFIPFIPVVISKITASSENENEQKIVKIINGFLIIFFLVYFFYSAKTGHDILEIYPYKTFWSD